MGKSGSPFRWFECLAGVIGTVVMMSVRLPRSLRPVGDRLAGRGIDICHETVRLWWNRSGPMFADEIRRNCGRAMRCFTQWPWLVCEVFASIDGKRHDLWRA